MLHCIDIVGVHLLLVGDNQLFINQYLRNQKRKMCQGIVGHFGHSTVVSCESVNILINKSLMDRKMNTSLCVR